MTLTEDDLTAWLDAAVRDAPPVPEAVLAVVRRQIEAPAPKTKAA